MTLFETLFNPSSDESIGVINIDDKPHLLYSTFVRATTNAYWVNTKGIIQKGAFDIAVIRNLKYCNIPNATDRLFFTADVIDDPSKQLTGVIYFYPKEHNL